MKRYGYSIELDVCQYHREVYNTKISTVEAETIDSLLRKSSGVNKTTLTNLSMTYFFKIFYPLHTTETFQGMRDNLSWYHPTNGLMQILHFNWLSYEIRRVFFRFISKKALLLPFLSV